MTFTHLLTAYIGFLPLKEVADRCAAQGHPVDASSLSRMRSGQRPAPDDDGLVQAIAAACGKDPEPLRLLAAVERRPLEVFGAIFAALGEGDDDQARLRGVAEFAKRIRTLPVVESDTPPPAPVDMAVTVIIGSGSKVLAQFTKPFRATGITPADIDAAVQKVRRRQRSAVDHMGELRSVDGKSVERLLADRAAELTQGTLIERYPPVVEQYPEGWMAYNDLANAVVAGENEGQARQRYAEALKALVEEYGEPATAHQGEHERGE